MIKEIKINADDFGYNSSVNKAIAESFNNNYINSSTLMANMPGFEEAVELANKNNLLTKAGIHLNLTEGKPLTSGIQNTKLFYNENNTDLKRQKKNLFFLTKDDKNLIFKEFEAQIEKVKNAGFQITHIDTHHHIDEVWSITQIILSLLTAYNIPSMRILNNLNQSARIYKSAYRIFVNKFINIRSSNFSDFLGNQLEAIAQFKKDRSLFDDKILEIMVHPDYNKEGRIIDKIQKKEVSFDYPDDFKKYIHT